VRARRLRTEDNPNAGPTKRAKALVGRHRAPATGHARAMIRWRADAEVRAPSGHDGYGHGGTQVAKVPRQRQVGIED
jgi:hypothetical protein